jgi:hypothetical protein
MDAHTGASIHVHSPRNKNKKYRPRPRRTRAGQCAAAVGAVTAAGLYLAGHVPNLAVAAVCCGSCVTYVHAAITLLRSENATTLERVLQGQLPLQVAARQVKQLAALVDAYRTAAAADRVAFAKAIGPTVLFDSALVPAI